MAEVQFDGGPPCQLGSGVPSGHAHKYLKDKEIGKDAASAPFLLTEHKT
ncbi:MAG: hypothetical protein ACI8QZ_004087 [Chlamydiales bacterium]|jgi:hypothetical protein